MTYLTKVQAVSRAYKNVSAIERAKPVLSSGLDTQSQHKHFQSSHDESRKSFSQILKERLQD